MHRLLFIIALFSSTFSNGQATVDTAKTTQVKKELRTLLMSLNDARTGHDRSALERIYAEEFVMVHSSGFVDDRATVINEIMETDSIRPLPVSTMENLSIYGDVAILRSPSNAVSGTVASNRSYGTFIYVRKAGNWQIAFGQGTALQPERKTIKLDNAVLDGFAGKYERMGQMVIVSRKDNGLLIHAVGRGIPKRWALPVSGTQFFDKLGIEYIYSKDDKGMINQLVVKFANGTQSEWKRASD